jgi:hypothetical protein
MRDRLAWPGIVLAVVVAGVLARAVPLLHSPVPATLDGFRYVSLAAALLETGRIPVGRIAADELVFTGWLAAGSRVTGVPPLALAQPLVVAAGAGGALVAVALAARTGRSLGWSDRRVRVAALAAGLALAVDGLYVRRTGVPDEEALGILLVPLLALAVHRGLAGRRRWWVAAAGLAVVFPPLHNLSSVVAALVVTGVAAVHVAASPDRRRVTLGAGAALALWAYVLGYFAVAGRLGLQLSYSGLVRDHPDLLVAWAVVLALGLAWAVAASGRARGIALFAPVALDFAVVAVNTVRPVYPGTIATPRFVLGPVALFALPVALAAVAVARVPVRGRPGDATVPVALLAGTVALSFLALTASLTPAFFDTVMRVQSFAHPGVVALAGVAAVAVGRPRTAGRALAVALVVTALLTLPLAHVHLDTGTYPSTMLESEHAATGFAATRLDGPFASDHRLGRLSAYAFGGGGQLGPTRQWLRGGPPPACPTLAQRSWATSGAHLYPAPPATAPPDAFAGWRARNDVVYAAGGSNPTWLVRPAGNASGGC